MLLGGSTLLLGLSAGSLMFFGPGASQVVTEGLALLGVLSAFVMICSTEARHAS